MGDEEDCHGVFLRGREGLGGGVGDGGHRRALGGLLVVFQRTGFPAGSGGGGVGDFGQEVRGTGEVGVRELVGVVVGPPVGGVEKGAVDEYDVEDRRKRWSGRRQRVALEGNSVPRTIQNQYFMTALFL